jgi:hypothetical protein
MLFWALRSGGERKRTKKYFRIEDWGNGHMEGYVEDIKTLKPTDTCGDMITNYVRSGNPAHKPLQPSTVHPSSVAAHEARED